MRILTDVLCVFSLPVIGLAAGSHPAAAQSAEEVQELRALLEEQGRVVQEQRQVIDRQRRDWDDQQGRIADLERTVQQLRVASDGGGFETGRAGRSLTGPYASEAFPADTSATLSLGAHLNRVINVADDGDDTKAYFVDSGNIPTFVFLKAAKAVSEDLTVRAHFEAAFSDNSALVVDQNNENSGLTIDGRFFEVVADSQKFGSLSFGKGFASSFSLFELDQSGIQHATLLSVGGQAGGLLFFNKRGNELSPLSVGSVFLDIEGLSLINRARYDSPLWKGFRLSGTVGADQYRDLTLRYAADWRDVHLFSVASYQRNPNGGFTDWRTDGGIGILHRPSGLNLTAGAQIQEANSSGGGLGQKGHGFVVRAGLRRHWLEMGETKLAIDYNRNWDIVSEDERSTSFGGLIMQDVDWLGLRLYAGYRSYKVSDLDVANLEDINVFTMGASLDFESTWDF